MLKKNKESCKNVSVKAVVEAQNLIKAGKAAELSGVTSQ